MAEYELQPGQMAGEYRIERKIGEGGFGKVYAAVHPVIGKAAAVKVLNPDLAHSPEIVSRFVDEARAVNQIRHRNIIDIFAFGTLPDGLHYFVMELLEGTPLDSYLESHGPLDPAHALSLLWPVGRALVAAHKAGIAHRDLKPENVFLTMDQDGGIFPKLLDFGIAKLLHEREMASRTRTGAMMGTPYYMSPEQCRGVGVDHRSDIYSFGILTHEVLTGRRPFVADNMMDLLMKQIGDPPPPMSSVRRDLPPALDAPVLHMLQKSADQRPQSMQAALDELAAAARSLGVDLPGSAQPSALPQPPRTPPPGASAVSPAGAPHLDTGAWLQRGGAPPAATSAASAAVTGPAAGYGQSYPQGPTRQSPGAMGPNAMGPGAMGPHGMGPGAMGPHGMGPGAMGPHAIGPGAAPRRSSSALGIVAAIVAGIVFVLGGGTCVALYAIGRAASVAEIRAEPPPVGAAFDRDVSTSANISFTAPGQAQPRASAEIRSHRRYRFKVKSVGGDRVTGADVEYDDAFTTTTFGGQSPQTEASAVAHRTFHIDAQSGAPRVAPADGQPAGEAESREVLADVGGVVGPRPAAFARELDIGDTVSLGSDEALALMGAGVADPGTTMRVDNATLDLDSVEGDQAKFDAVMTFVHDGGDPHMHIEAALTGTITLDTRSGLPLAIQLTGPLTGTLSSPDGALALSGTMKVEGH